MEKSASQDLKISHTTSMNHPRTQTSKNFGLGWRGRGRAPTAPTSREGPRERRSGVEHRDLQHIAATSRKRHHTDLHQHPPSVTPKPLAAKETGPDGSSPGRSLGPGPGCSSAFPGLAAPPSAPSALQSGEELYLRKLVGALGHEG